jgi:hypothetical protein
VTASEVAEYVFCKHAWYLRVCGTSVSGEAQTRMSAGLLWQSHEDERAAAAAKQAENAQCAFRFAWVTLFVVIAVLIAWQSYSHLQH